MSLRDSLRPLLDKSSEQEPTEDPVAAMVRRVLPTADDPTQRIVTAVVGVLSVVAYADGKYLESEAAQIRKELSLFPELDEASVDAICKSLDADIARFGAHGDHRWIRDLKQLAEPEARRELLEVLVDLAAADGELSSSEVEHMRRLTLAMGLDESDYDSAVERLSADKNKA